MSSPEPSSATTLGGEAETRACVRAVGALLGKDGDDVEGILGALDLTLEPVVLVDARRRVLYGNSFASELVGRPGDALQEQSCVSALGLVGCGQRCSMAGCGDPSGRKTCTLRSRTGEVKQVLKSWRKLTLGDRFLGGIEWLRKIDNDTCLEPAPRHLRPCDAEPGGTPVVQASAAMERTMALVTRLAQRDVTVLVTGESGVGKEIVARALHERGPRARHPFHAVNCAGLTDTLLESELFGHERGAFTGAITTKQGHIERCGTGTLFLDEIGCMSLAGQARLLRVLEQREYERVGGNGLLPVRCRIVAATNRDLRERVKHHQFREDLYYRLNVVALEVPPLRQRRDDVIPLARHFARLEGASSPCGPPALSADTERALSLYAWPGNVRELRNAITYAVALGEGPCIELGDLPPQIADSVRLLRAVHGGGSGDDANAIRRALLAAQHNRSRAARMLGMSRTTLWRRMRELGLS